MPKARDTYQLEAVGILVDLRYKELVIHAKCETLTEEVD